MRLYFFELLACPICKSEDLILYRIATVESKADVEAEKVRCRRWCALYWRAAEETPIEECKKCVNLDVQEGVIACRNCGRWYPIVDGVPIMLGEKLRKQEEDFLFLERNWEKIPGEVRKHMKIPPPIPSQR